MLLLCYSAVRSSITPRLVHGRMDSQQFHFKAGSMLRAAEIGSAFESSRCVGETPMTRPLTCRVHNGMRKAVLMCG